MADDEKDPEAKADEAAEALNSEHDFGEPQDVSEVEPDPSDDAMTDDVPDGDADTPPVPGTDSAPDDAAEIAEDPADAADDEDSEDPSDEADDEPTDADDEPTDDAGDDEPADDDEADGSGDDAATGTATRRRRGRRGGRRRAAVADDDAPAPPKPTAQPERRAPRTPGERHVVQARARYVRTSARKARLVCDHIRGKSVDEARAILAHTPRAVAEDWIKLLESAVANAEHNHELVGDDLRILAVYADEGPTLKRYRPRAMGRATRIRKRTSHLTIKLTEKE